MDSRCLRNIKEKQKIAKTGCHEEEQKVTFRMNKNNG